MQKQSLTRLQAGRRRVATRKAAEKKAAARKIGRKKMMETFLDDNPMDSKVLGCTLEHFRSPHLQRCPFDKDSISFMGRINPRNSLEIDGGLDGYNWKVRFEDGQIFILKLFWDTKAPEPPHYFAAQRECQNAALFQMMKTAISKDNELGPIVINPYPKTQDEARANLAAFSDEIRQQNRTIGVSSMRSLTSIPRIRTCYGWMKFTGEELIRQIPNKLYPPPIKVGNVKRSIEQDAHYIAIIYEYIEEGENYPNIVQPVLDFYWHVGFSYVATTLARNWKNGVLIDFSDIVHANGYGWDSEHYGFRTVNAVLQWGDCNNLMLSS